jgi:hypothetical protein
VVDFGRGTAAGVIVILVVSMAGMDFGRTESSSAEEEEEVEEEIEEEEEEEEGTAAVCCNSRGAGLPGIVIFRPELYGSFDRIFMYCSQRSRILDRLP